jgi:ATP-dependent Clp protease adaptor protein ClpS
LLLVSLLGIVLGGVFGVLVHEAGHAIVGRLAGYRIRLIRIGQGPELFRLHIGLALLVWRLLPSSGSVAIYRPLADARHARLMLFAGGSIANALVACGLAALLPWPPDPEAHPILTNVLIGQAVGVLNLLLVIGHGRADGARFRAALRLPSTMPDRVLRRLYASKVTDRYDGLPPEPPSALAAVVLHAVLIGTPEATYDHLEGMETAQARRERIRLRDALLTRTDLTTAERATLLDAQASLVAPPVPEPGQHIMSDKPSGLLAKVQLLNDDHTPMEFVVHVLERVFDKDGKTATRIMLEIHKYGTGTCGIYPNDVADAKVREVLDLAREHQHPLQCVLERSS